MPVKKQRAANIILLLALVAAVLTTLAPDALAQCAMCKATASNLDAVSARTLNLSTLILLCPPVAIFCAIFVIAYKHRNSPGDDADDS
jgi:heme/copper-type cytochrome/quinol oxidase subunit 2